MNAAEKAAAVREALSKHSPPTPAELRAFRASMGLPEEGDTPEGDPSAGLARLAVNISGVQHDGMPEGRHG